MILMQIEGIDGTSKIKDHDKWIQCESLSWGVARPITETTGRTADRTGTVVQAQDVMITKIMDSSSARLFELACGKEGKTVKIDFLAGAGTSAPPYAQWTLEKTLISSYSIGGASQTEATESLTLNFVTIEVKSIETAADAKTTTPYPVKFSREAGALV